MLQQRKKALARAPSTRDPIRPWPASTSFHYATVQRRVDRFGFKKNEILFCFTARNRHRVRQKSISSTHPALGATGRKMSPKTKYTSAKKFYGSVIKPVDDLIINLQPEETHPDGTTYRLPNDEAHSLGWAIYQAILASRWNMLDPAVSVQNRFHGALKHQKTCLQEVTSLSLFRDDVERLLRDLYGDINSEALERTLRSTLTIVQEFTRFVRKDLWQEHQDAENWDFILGIGVPEGMGINGSDWRHGLKACDDLRLRARRVSENPSAFGKYTVEFATIHLGQFIKLEGPLFSDDPELALEESPPF
jgi:hypothetical protein